MIIIRPRWKQESKRTYEFLGERRRAMWFSGKASKELAGIFASASPPTLRTQRVATAIANQKRVALFGSTMRVYCHCQPALLICLKPDSIQARSPYQQGKARLGGKSVRISQGSSRRKDGRWIFWAWNSRFSGCQVVWNWQTFFWPCIWTRRNVQNWVFAQLESL